MSALQRQSRKRRRNRQPLVLIVRPRWPNLGVYSLLHTSITHLSGITIKISSYIIHSVILRVSLYSTNFRRLLLWPTSPYSTIATLRDDALNRYIGNRNADGGWGSIPASQSNAWTTAQAAYLLTRLDRSRYKGQIVAALEWLVNNQNHDGGWGIDLGISDTTGTELAIYSLANTDEERYHDVALKGVDWLLAKQNMHDGGWAFQPQRQISSIYCTTWAIIALRTVLRFSNNTIIDRVNLSLAKRFLQDAANMDYGWGKFHKTPTEGIRTAYALLGLKHLGLVNTTVFRQGRQALLREQSRSDGGWGDDLGSSVEGTSWALISLLDSDNGVFTTSVAGGLSYIRSTRALSDGFWPERAGEYSTIWCSHHVIFALTLYLERLQPYQNTSSWNVLWKRRTTVLYVALKLSTVMVLTIVISLSVISLYFLISDGVVTAGRLTIFLTKYSVPLAAISSIIAIIFNTRNIWRSFRG